MAPLLLHLLLQAVLSIYHGQKLLIGAALRR